MDASSSAWFVAVGAVLAAGAPVWWRAVPPTAPTVLGCVAAAAAALSVLLECVAVAAALSVLLECVAAAAVAWS